MYDGVRNMNDTHNSVPNGSSLATTPCDSSKDEEVLSARRIVEGQWNTLGMQLRAQEWFDFAADGYLLTNMHGVIHEANYAAARVLGARKEFLRDKPLGLFMTEKSHAAFYERLTRLATQTDVEQWETCLSSLSGKTRQIMLKVTVQADEGGVKLRWVLHDITDLREAQRQSLQAERLAAIGQMAAGLAHEGRNALQRIQASLALLTLRLQGQQENLDLLGRIQKAQDDLQHLFEDVRNYAVAPRLDRRWHDLRTIWREAWNELANLAAWRSAELKEDVKDSELSCRVDSFYLKHVLRNLLENALACGANPVRVGIECQPATLGGREALCLRLRDNGPGFSAQMRSRLFEPFLTTKAHGTGLGLAICKRIVEAHGGQIEASGGCALGAEIVIVLPRRGT
jgi:PAS domain S-box-containing protein